MSKMNRLDFPKARLNKRLFFTGVSVIVLSYLAMGLLAQFAEEKWEKTLLGAVFGYPVGLGIFLTSVSFRDDYHKLYAFFASLGFAIALLIVCSVLT